VLAATTVAQPTTATLSFTATGPSTRITMTSTAATSTFTITAIPINFTTWTSGTIVTTVCSKDGDAYRYGFNGKLKDNEWAGIGNHLEFGLRLYDSRIGRFISLDLDAKKYPHMSPYVYAADNPIWFTDKDGRGPKDVQQKLTDTRLQIEKVTNEEDFKSYKNAMPIIKQQYDLGKLDPKGGTQFQVVHGLVKYFETSQASEPGIAHTISFGSANAEAALEGDNVLMGNFVDQIIHEYVHVFQVNTLHMTDHDEQEFLANSFTVFPNTSVMRSMIPNWKVELPDASGGQRIISAKAALNYYKNLSKDLQNKYKDEFVKDQGVYDELSKKYQDDGHLKPSTQSSSTTTTKSSDNAKEASTTSTTPTN
jgi:RHS repeat-associated protein